MDAGEVVVLVLLEFLYVEVLLLLGLVELLAQGVELVVDFGHGGG